MSMDHEYMFIDMVMLVLMVASMFQLKPSVGTQGLLEVFPAATLRQLGRTLKHSEP